MQSSKIEFDLMSATDFEMLGINHVAYVKEVSDGTSTKFAVYSANGAEIGLMDADRDVTFAAVRQNDMEPVSVH